MNVVMIGAGYVGLTTGACFASLGYKVCCVDIDEGRVADLKNGIMPIYEPGLAELIVEGRKAGRLRFSADIGASVADADFVFLAVGTPSTTDGDIDLSFVDAAARGIAPFFPITLSWLSSRRSWLARQRPSPTSSLLKELAAVLLSPQILSSCAKGRPSPTSGTRIGLWLARTTKALRIP